MAVVSRFVSKEVIQEHFFDDVLVIGTKALTLHKEMCCFFLP